MHVSAGVLRGQGKVLDALEPEFHVAVSCLLWMLGTELESSEKTMNALRCPSPLVTFHGGEELLRRLSPGHKALLTGRATDCPPIRPVLS